VGETRSWCASAAAICAKATQSRCASATAGGLARLAAATNCEDRVQLRTSVDAFAAYEFCELDHRPSIRARNGRALEGGSGPRSWSPTKPFRLAIVARTSGASTEAVDQPHLIVASRRSAASPTASSRAGASPCVIDGLVADTAGRPRAAADAEGEEVARDNRCAWRNRRCGADIGAICRQSGGTIGMGTEAYFAMRRDKAFVDIVGPRARLQTREFWASFNRLTAAFDAPAASYALPGTNGRQHTAWAADSQIFFSREGRPSRRSSHILVQGESVAGTECYRRTDIFRALENEDAIVIAHVGGRYAEHPYAPTDGSSEPSSALTWAR